MKMTTKALRKEIKDASDRQRGKASEVRGIEIPDMTNFDHKEAVMQLRVRLSVERQIREEHASGDKSQKIRRAPKVTDEQRKVVEQIKTQLLSFVGTRLFAGLTKNEVSRLRWDDIVNSLKSKKASDAFDQSESRLNRPHVTPEIKVLGKDSPLPTLPLTPNVKTMVVDQSGPGVETEEKVLQTPEMKRSKLISEIRSSVVNRAFKTHAHFRADSLMVEGINAHRFNPLNVWRLDKKEEKEPFSRKVFNSALADPNKETSGFFIFGSSTARQEPSATDRFKYLSVCQKRNSLTSVHAMIAASLGSYMTAYFHEQDLRVLTRNRDVLRKLLELPLDTEADVMVSAISCSVASIAIAKKMLESVDAVVESFKIELNSTKYYPHQHVEEGQPAEDPMPLTVEEIFHPKEIEAYKSICDLIENGYVETVYSNNPYRFLGIGEGTGRFENQVMSASQRAEAIGMFAATLATGTGDWEKLLNMVDQTATWGDQLTLSIRKFAMLVNCDGKIVGNSPASREAEDYIDRRLSRSVDTAFLLRVSFHETPEQLRRRFYRDSVLLGDEGADKYLPYGFLATARKLLA